MKVHSTVARTGWIIILLLGWETVRRGTGASPLAMPAISTILSRLWELAAGGELASQILFSLAMIIAGLLIATVMATALVIAGERWGMIDSLLSTLISLFHPLPGVALLPIVILWFGIGPPAVLVIIVHSVLWPLITNIRAGHASMPQVYRLVGRNLGMSGLVFFFRITLPAIAPFLLSGMRISWARGWRALISAEMIFGAVSGTGGLGWFLHSRRAYMDTPGLFVGILVIMVVGVLVENTILRLVEKRTIERWGMAI